MYAKLAKILESLSWDGLGDIATAKSRKEKLFWIVIFTTAFAGFVYGASGTIAEFQSNPSLTEIDVVPNNTMLLPQVAICAESLYNISKIQENPVLLRSINEPVFATLLRQYFYNRTTMTSNEYRALKDEYLHRIDLGMSLGEFLYNYTLDCSSILSHCSVGYWQFDCCDALLSGTKRFQVRKKLHSSGRVCFHMKFKNILGEQRNVGQTNGLNVIVHRRSYVTDHRSGLDSVHPGIGFMVGVGKVIDVSRIKGVAVPFGVVADVALKMTHYVKIPSAQTSCTPFDPRTYKHGWEMETCKAACWELAVRSNCFCSRTDDIGSLEKDFLALRQEYNRTCEMFEYLDCMLNDTALRSGWDTCTRANCYVPPPCEEWEYSIQSVSYMNANQMFMTQAYGIDANDSVTSMHLHFPDLSWEVYKEHQSMTLFQLIGDFGGQMGLFLGGSMITLVQLIVYCLKLCATETKANWIKQTKPLADRKTPPAD